MRCYPPEGATLQIALLTGHTATIPPGGRDDLPVQFHREALALGCRFDGLPDAAAPETEPEFNRHQVVFDAIADMVQEGNPGEFIGDGKPDLRVLSTRVGFTVLRDERDAVWRSFAASGAGLT